MTYMPRPLVAITIVLSRGWMIRSHTKHTGNPLVIVPRKRMEVTAGISMKGETVRHPVIEENIKKLCSTLKFIGPVNIQFKEDSSGNMKLVEINPRFSGGLPITAEAGANTPELLYRLLKGDPVTTPEWREGVFENNIVNTQRARY